MDFNSPPTTPIKNRVETPKRNPGGLSPYPRSFDSPNFGKRPRKERDFYNVPLGPSKIRKNKQILENMKKVVAKKVRKIHKFITDNHTNDDFSDIKGYGEKRDVYLPVENLQEMFGLLRQNLEYFANWIDVNGNTVEFKPKAGYANSHESGLLNVEVLSSHTHPNKKRRFNPPSANDIRAVTEKLRDSTKSVVISSHLVFVPSGIYVFSIHPWLVKQSISRMDVISDAIFEELDWLSGGHVTTETEPQINFEDYTITMGRLGVHVRFYSEEELNKQKKPTVQIMVQKF